MRQRWRQHRNFGGGAGGIFAVAAAAHRGAAVAAESGATARGMAQCGGLPPLPCRSLGRRHHQQRRAQAQLKSHRRSPPLRRPLLRWAGRRRRPRPRRRPQTAPDAAPYVCAGDCDETDVACDEADSAQAAGEPLALRRLWRGAIEGFDPKVNGQAPGARGRTA